MIIIIIERSTKADLSVGCCVSERAKARIEQVKKIAESAAEETPKVMFIGGARDTYYYYPPSWCMIDEMIEGAGGEYMELLMRCAVLFPISLYIMLKMPKAFVR